MNIPCVYKGPSKSNQQQDDGSPNRLEKIESTLEAIKSILEHQHGTSPRSTIAVSRHSEPFADSPSSILFGKHRPLPRMPNLFAFNGPDLWRYDCTEDFFSDQLGSLSDMRNVQIAELDLSRPHLWRLQQSFVENVLKWFPLFDYETGSKHLQAAQTSKHELSSTSLCLVYLIYAIGSLALDSRLYVQSLDDLPGFAYYTKAFETMKDFPHFSTDICILQCRTLVA